jgi:hypothetical protein
MKQNKMALSVRSAGKLGWRLIAVLIISVAGWFYILGKLGMTLFKWVAA